MTPPSSSFLAYGLTFALALTLLVLLRPSLLTTPADSDKPGPAPVGDKRENKKGSSSSNRGATTTATTTVTSSTARSTIMQAEREDLLPPKDDPFTQEELKAYDGTDANKPIYVAIKGTVFDVSRKRDTYGPGGSYALFAGKDGSRALGLSSLKPEDAVPDWSTLEEKDRKTLDDWHAFFTKRYNIVGRVVDLPEAVANK